MRLRIASYSLVCFTGALNEAISDIFGAAIERFVNPAKTIDDTWRLGEDVYIATGRSIRYMAKPTNNGQPDYYPERYIGSYSYMRVLHQWILPSSPPDSHLLGLIRK